MLSDGTAHLISTHAHPPNIMLSKNILDTNLTLRSLYLITSMTTNMLYSTLEILQIDGLFSWYNLNTTWHIKFTHFQTN